jgi:hypothetical protein
MNKAQSNQETNATDIPATYQEVEPQEPCNNPLIEALPPTDSEIQVQDPLKFHNIVKSVICMKPSYIRSQTAENTAEFSTPLPIHIALQHRVDCMLRNGYLNRNLIASYCQRLNIELLIIDIE